MCAIEIVGESKLPTPKSRRRSSSHTGGAMIARRTIGRITCMIVLGGLCAIGAVALLPATARAQATCNGFLDIAFPQIPTFPNCGTLGPRCVANNVTQECDCCVFPDDVVDMRINLGAGGIVGGSFLALFDFLVGLDCKRFVTLPGVDATCAPNPDGPRVAFADSITTNCPNAFPPPNIMPFTAVPAPVPPFAPLTFDFQATPFGQTFVKIPENTPDFCHVDFKFKVLNPPTDASCTTGPQPLSCCTAAGTGFCQKTDNASCTGVNVPYPCCTGTGVGFCGFTNADCTGLFTPAPCCFAAGVGLCNSGSGSDASCTSGPAPFSCCTGAGTGFCEAKDNAACT